MALLGYVIRDAEGESFYMRAGILYAKRLYAGIDGALPNPTPFAVQCGACPRISKTDEEHNIHYLAEHTDWQTWA
jgi:hypothetical protein